MTGILRPTVSRADFLSDDVWRTAVSAMRAHKLRVFLSTLGVVIGSASIVLVVTAGLTGERYVIDQIEGVGANVAYAELRRTGAMQPASLSDEMTMADLDAVRTQIPGVTAAAGSRDIPMSVTAPGGQRAATLIGVTDGFQEIRHLSVVAGRYFDADELRSAPKVCLLTEELAGVMFPHADPTGAIARVGDLRLTVVGVFKERVSTFGASEVQRESILVPFRLLRNFSGAEFIKVLYVQAAAPGAVPDLTRALGAFLQRRHRADARYQTENLTALLAAAERISAALSVTLLLVAFVALAVSGIGIMNVMLVTVRERAQEIGLRKAVGASQRTILAQFLLEAGLMSGTGALLGVGLAMVLLLPIRWLLPPELTLRMSGVSILVAVGASASVGVIFGYLPARRAAALQPADTLRHE